PVTPGGASGQVVIIGSCVSSPRPSQSASGSRVAEMSSWLVPLGSKATGIGEGRASAALRTSTEPGSANTSTHPTGARGVQRKPITSPAWTGIWAEYLFGVTPSTGSTGLLSPTIAKLSPPAGRPTLSLRVLLPLENVTTLQLVITPR